MLMERGRDRDDVNGEREGQRMLMERGRDREDVDGEREEQRGC